MTKKIEIIITLILLFVLSACVKEEESVNYDYIDEYVVPTIVDDCGYELEDYLGDIIPIQNISSSNSTVLGNLENFTNVCKESDSNPIILTDSSINSYKIFLTLEYNYPIKEIEIMNFIDDQNLTISDVDISVSLDGVRYDKIHDDYPLNDTVTVIPLDNTLAKSIKITFKNDESQLFYGLNDIKVVLGEGMIVKEDSEWTDAFLNYSGWSGADGVFSFNLTNGNDTIGATADTTGFVFSDTFIGEANSETNIRFNDTMINNTFGYYLDSDLLKENLEFEWDLNEDTPQSLFLPNSYIGYTESNIVNNIGLDIYQTKEAKITSESNGNMWRSETTDNVSVTFDMKDIVTISEMYIWNYNDDTSIGIKDISIYSSGDGIEYTLIDTYTINQATGQDMMSYSSKIEFDSIEAKYIKINIQSNYQDTATQFGIGKIMFFDNENQYIYPSVDATSTDLTIEDNELTSRLWIQDGVVIDDYLYLFPLLVKDYQSFFKVYKTGIIKVPIVDERLDYDNLEYLDSDLTSVDSTGSYIYYGAGVLNNTVYDGNENGDGYIYIYGYKDYNGRHLTVARCLPEDITNTNNWTYYNGTDFVNDINQSKELIEGVSPELSVTYIPSGMYEGKFMLIVMEDTTSGYIGYSISDTPYGDFEDFETIYKTSIGEQYNGAFSYNAKMHSHLSEEGNYLISYNVNTTSLSGLNNVDVYRPRFIRMIEVKTR